MREKLVSGNTNANRIIFNDKDKEKTLIGLNIGQTFIDAQKTFNEICDFEWGIINSKLFFLQYRSVTEKIDDFITSNIEKENSLGVSSGVTTGEVCFLDSIIDEDKFKEGNILVTIKTDVRWMKVLKKCSGLITKNGSLLCHAAIIARELKIPCITAIDDETFEKLKNAKKVKMNGSTGKIEIIK